MTSYTPAQALAASQLPDEALLLECDERFFVASGPGGQNRNKRETGVGLFHRPSGLSVSATERRSQLMNRGAALERLRAKLQKLGTPPKPRRPTATPRRERFKRLTNKRLQAQKKQTRKGVDD